MSVVLCAVTDQALDVAAHEAAAASAEGGASVVAPPTETPWRRVVFTADCDEDGNCPVCGIDYGECDRPGSTMDEMEYREIDACYGHAPARQPERRVEPPPCRRRSR